MIRNLIRFAACFALVSLFGNDATSEENYVACADSFPRANVPKGKLEGPIAHTSEIFPGTQRNYHIYVPANHDPQVPTCVLVVQDGIKLALRWKLPTVLDNLIDQEKMPPVIGVFVEPGVVPAPNDNSQPRFNRCFEYDSMTDRYARFLLEEILPAVGEKYKLSEDPNDRAIAGSSSGGICAFTVAWQRPNEFRRVFSSVGSFVSLRGGNEYPTLIRKTEPKPIRVILQDGSADQDIYGGNWWVANQDMLSALKFAGYSVNHVWGEGGHNSKHATAVMPTVMRWLWQDHPSPIQSGVAPKRRTDILKTGSGWQVASSGHGLTEALAANDDGEVFFADSLTNKIHKIDLQNRVGLFAEEVPQTTSLAFDGNSLCAAHATGIYRYDVDSQRDLVADLDSGPLTNLMSLPRGRYCADKGQGKVWHVAANGQQKLATEEVPRPGGLVCSPDHSLLWVADASSDAVYSYQIQENGDLRFGQSYGKLHVDVGDGASGCTGMAVDAKGRVYVATPMGIQVLDPLGRCHLILPLPDQQCPKNLVFGGRERDTLFVTTGTNVLKRQLNARGVASWQEPRKPPRPGL